MSWFRNIKIATKLISSFLLVAIFIVVVGVVDSAGIRTMIINTSDMFNGNLKSIDNLHILKENLKDQQIELLKDMRVQMLLLYRLNNNY